MPNYFDGTEDDQLIIRSEEVLLPDYMPDELVHRSRELQVIADSIKPLIKRRTPDNLFIYGHSGSGKTTCVKYIIKQLLEHSSAVLPVYVNCWQNQTQMSVYNQIIEAMRLPLPRRGLATDEIFVRITQYVRNYRKPILLILDEMDGLRDDKLLYVVSRANEHHLMFGIIGISNNNELLSKLDPRVRSSLRFSDMDFGQYSEEQLISILKTRAERALGPGTYNDRLLTKIARSTEDGSARVAIERLWKSAKHAEKARHDRIMLQDVEDVIAAEPPFRLPNNLSTEELLIVELLEEKDLGSSELYERFTKKIPKTKRQIRNYIELLEKKGVVKSEDLGKEGMLSPKIFRLNKA